MTGAGPFQVLPPGAAIPYQSDWLSLANTSPARCCGEPLPALAKFSVPGLALASAISSASVCAFTDGCTTNTSGTVPTMDTAVKLFSMS